MPHFLLQLKIVVQRRKIRARVLFGHFKRTLDIEKRLVVFPEIMKNILYPRIKGIRQVVHILRFFFQQLCQRLDSFWVHADQSHCVQHIGQRCCRFHHALRVIQRFRIIGNCRFQLFGRNTVHIHQRKHGFLHAHHRGIGVIRRNQLANSGNKFAAVFLPKHLPDRAADCQHKPYVLLAACCKVLHHFLAVLLQIAAINVIQRQTQASAQEASAFRLIAFVFFLQPPLFQPRDRNFFAAVMPDVKNRHNHAAHHFHGRIGKF